jgi:hypothetical protein
MATVIQQVEKTSIDNRVTVRKRDFSVEVNVGSEVTVQLDWHEARALGAQLLRLANDEPGERPHVPDDVIDDSVLNISEQARLNAAMCSALHECGWHQSVIGHRWEIGEGFNRAQIMFSDCLNAKTVDDARTLMVKAGVWSGSDGRELKAFIELMTRKEEERPHVPQKED